MNQFFRFSSSTFNGTEGEIVSRFETKGFKLAAMKTKMATKDLLEQHYEDLVEKPFFPKLRDYMLSGPLVVRFIYNYVVLVI